ncbi:MAG: ribosomal-processing cysteine protease Prp [Spirochaetota bacterium]
MITVRAVLDDEGCLRRLSVLGHASAAGGSPGTNVVCAAATAIVRAVAEAIAARSTIAATGAAARPGELLVEIGQREPGDAEWLRGVADVLKTGIGRLAAELPGEVEFVITRRGEHHGS